MDPFWPIKQKRTRFERGDSPLNPPCLRPCEGGCVLLEPPNNGPHYYYAYDDDDDDIGRSFCV